MGSSREIYSEDDNFLIGDDFNADRHRREARQLHRSEFKTVRREAHFARYRNSFLKCDLDQTNDRIEQARRLRSAEIERAKAAVMKQAESRRNGIRQRPNEDDAKVYVNTNGKLVSNVSQSRKAKSKDLGTESRLVRRSQQGFRRSVTTLSLSRASSVTGKRTGDLAGENKKVISSMSTGNGRASSLGSNVNEKHIDQVSRLENAGTIDEKEFDKRSHSFSESKSDSGRNSVAKSPSARAVNGRTPLLDRRRSSATNFQDTEAKKTQTQSAHERWMWKEFDKIMKGFSDFLKIEHKSVNLRSEAAVDKERLRPPQNTTLLKRNSLNTLSPLYFRYGTSDQIAFRF